MKTIKSIFFFLIFISCFINISAKSEPDWVTKRPISSQYYIGIAKETKSKSNKDYVKIAKDRALRELASEIEVNISSEVINNILEKSGEVEENFSSYIQTTTKAELEGYELIDTYETKKEYWVYYRLSKEKYYKLKREKIDKAIKLSLDLFKEAKSNEKQNNFIKAIRYYFQALTPIEKYFAESLEVDYEGKTIELSNEIYFSLQELFSSLKMKPYKSKVSVKIGQNIKNPVKFSIIYLPDNSRPLPVKNAPIKFDFIRGDADFIDSAESNNDGIADCRIRTLKSKEKMQILGAEFNFKELIQADTTSIILSSLIKSLPIPKAKAILNITSLTVCVETEEKIYGKNLSPLYIEPKIKEKLSEYGYNFVDDPTEADLYLEIKASSREGSKVYNLISAFVDVNISAVNMTSGEEIYKNSLTNVKGIDLDKNKAALKAFTACAEKITNEILPEIEKKNE